MEQGQRITIIFGPPKRDEDKKKMESISEKTGKSVDHVWVDFMHTFFNDFTKKKADKNASSFEELLSLILDMPARLQEYFLGEHYHREGLFPAITIETSKITTEDGSPVRADWSNIIQFIAQALCEITKSEWSRSMLTYG